MATNSICKIEGCGKRVVAREMCSAHYQRCRVHGNPLAGGTLREKRGPICIIDGCGSPEKTKGYCVRHYDKLKVYGDPLAGRDAAAPLRYFLDVVLPYDGDDCLKWPFSGNGNGYGKITYKGKRRYVHRAVCEEVNGPPPSPEHDAAHSCGKGHEACVTKRHLSWKTRAGNQADKLVHGTHQNGERNTQAKLTADDVREIRALQGVMTQKEIAERFGIHSGQVSKIFRRERWAWLD